MPSPTETFAIPQPRVRPVVGNVPDIGLETPVQGIVRLCERFGPILRLTVPGRSFVVLGSHELAADACDPARFEKHLHGPLQILRDFAGDGLFTAHNDEPNWGKAHRLLMPAFGPAAMRGYFEAMLDIAEQMLTKWERLGPQAEIDVADAMTRLTLDTIALTGFGYRFNSYYQREMHPFVEAMVRALEEAGARAKRPAFQTKLMRKADKRYRADRDAMHALTQELIAARRALSPEEAPRDLLGLMLEGADPLTGEKLDDENIRNQLVTFLVAGHETTSGLLSFAVHELLRQPEVLAKARACVDAVLGGELPRFEHLAELGYLDQVLRETLRLYPTAPAFAVRAKADTTLAGKYPVRRGDAFMIMLPVLHRDPAVWEEPERFDPERFAPARQGTIPPHAWMPFGNGPRACIGRAFALQEATLVLAMMLQRFELRPAGPYTLKIKETLTLKPEGLKVKVRARRPLPRLAAPRPAPAPLAAVFRPVTASPHGEPLLVLYGSNSGAGEAFARRIASDGTARGYEVKVVPLDEAVGRLPTDGAVVLVSASYNGQPPDNARAFVPWAAALPAGALAGVRYAVFGCGNRDWGATYQAIPRALDEALGAAGASALLPRGEADARGDFFGDFERWYAAFWPALDGALGVTSGAVSQGPLYEAEILPPASAAQLRQSGLDYAVVLENRELVDMRSPLGRSKRHLELRLPAGATYAAGDYLAVLPRNHPELVERVARRFELSPEAAVILKSNRGQEAASLPTGRPVPLQELLGRLVELSAPATRKDVELLAEKNVCPPHKAQLEALAADEARYRAELLEKRVSLLELLEQYPSSIVSFADFLERLPAMRVRQYSISSSPRLAPERCSLTVAVLDAPAWSGRGRFHGTASSYLGSLRPGDVVAVAVRSPRNPFHPPLANETPMIMIAAGTGLAPFRGFIQERAERRAAGETPGPAALFFGCDHPDVDFLYRDELAIFEAEGLLSVHPAYFKQPEGEVTFVQHRLWHERERVSALLEAGAAVFVCGDGRRMAPAVRETLARIHREAKGATEAEAQAWLADLEREGRYVADVFA